ncbi:hypothetical protein [Mycobacterium timonense]|uniref:hypothetical protein n=1 Tax=Mycobacterium timonense TaxID=701043 RepID=UPI0012BBBB9E|nr:hypothetical protein [Mycobacterium timonense]
MDPLERAVASFLAYPPGDDPICPPAIWPVGPDAEVYIRPGHPGSNPFHGMVVSAWL